MSWRIDDLAREADVTVDTIRFYQREGLIPPSVRVGRTKQYDVEHLERLHQIRDLQGRRFSLAAIKALLTSDRQDLVDGIFAGEGSLSYSLGELVERSGVSAETTARLRSIGLLRDPAEFGRAAYDATDLDMLRATAELRRLSLPDDILVELASIYVDGVETMQKQVLDLFSGQRGPAWDPQELAVFQSQAASAAGQLLPLVTRIVEYVHLRTLQRLTLGVIDRADDDGDEP
ncbi:MAG: MerR family transcriptional regulator [Acidimicrobiia bacterium]|nr:MerR family transcriptional regulator [Acidimicrobiia bacterium]